MNKQTPIQWLTQTAIFLALLIALQSLTTALENTIITGSIVNAILILSVLLSGIKTGVWVAVLSPVLAKLIGIGPLWSLLPVIMIGNLVLILIWHFRYTRWSASCVIRTAVCVILAAVLKFLVLYMGIVECIIPYVLHLPQAQATLISNMFSLPQLFTALFGGCVAILCEPWLRNAMIRN